jgi:hypothetical protein
VQRFLLFILLVVPLPLFAEQSLVLKHGKIELRFVQPEVLNFELFVPSNKSDIKIGFRKNPQRLIFNLQGDYFSDSKSVKITGAAIKTAHFLDRGGIDLIVLPFESAASIQYKKAEIVNGVQKYVFAEKENESVEGSDNSQTIMHVGEPGNQEGRDLFDDREVYNKSFDLKELEKSIGLDPDNKNEFTQEDLDSKIAALRLAPIVPSHVVSPVKSDSNTGLILFLGSGMVLGWLSTLFLLAKDRLKKHNRREKRLAKEQAISQLKQGSKEGLREAYQALGLKMSDGDEEIKSRYKHLVKIFHADALSSKELPPEVLSLANSQFNKIQEAYLQIKESRDL